MQEISLKSLVGKYRAKLFESAGYLGKLFPL
jgi:hypothetical protein